MTLFWLSIFNHISEFYKGFKENIIINQYFDWSSLFWCSLYTAFHAALHAPFYTPLYTPFIWACFILLFFCQSWKLRLYTVFDNLFRNFPEKYCPFRTNWDYCLLIRRYFNFNYRTRMPFTLEIACSLVIVPYSNLAILASGNKMFSLWSQCNSIEFLSRALNWSNDLPIIFFPIRYLSIWSNRQNLILFRVQKCLFEGSWLKKAENPCMIL